MPRARRVVSVGAVAVGASLLAAPLHAAPEFGTGIAVGVAGTGEPVAWSKTRFFGAFRGEALFGPERPLALRLGPALEVGTVGFSDARFTAGASVLVPLDEVLVITLTPGAYARVGGGTTLGVSSRAFFGVHPFNRVGAYGLSAGLLVGLDRDLGATPESALVVALQVDGMALALPVILLVEWIRGPRD